MATKIDLSSALAGLGKVGDAAYGVSRSMAVAAGQVVRDEAKARAPVESGGLRDAIYLAFRDGESTQTLVKYQVTWNAKKAPHGHLLEFGHWRYNVFINGKPQKSLAPGLKRGKGPQDHTGPGALETPVWTAAYPFLRPAYEATKGRLLDVAVTRGRQRFAEIMSGKAGSEE